MLAAFTQASQSGGLTDEQLTSLEELVNTQKIKSRLVPELPHESEDEIKLKARELAKATRERGMGVLDGQFPKEYSEEKKLENQKQRLGFSKAIELNPKESFWLRDNLQYELYEKVVPGEHVWISSTKVPKQPYRENPLLNSNFDGWTKFIYRMPIEQVYDKSKRHGTVMRLYVFVPPEVAAEIDEALAQNPLFPNEYFQALYPDLIGLNTDTHLKRLPATKLVKIDYRTSPDKPQETVVEYPKPIQY